MDCVGIDQDSMFKFMDSILKDSRKRKIEEENTIVNSCEQNVDNKPSVNLDSEANSVLDRGKEIDCKSNSEPANTVPVRSVVGRRRLVRNGCISPCNVAKAKQLAEKSDSTRDQFAEANDSCRISGKGVSNHSFLRPGPNSNITSRNSNRGVHLGGSNGHHDAVDTLRELQNPAADSINDGLQIMDPAIEVDNYTPERINVGTNDVGCSCGNDVKSLKEEISDQQFSDQYFAWQLQREIYSEVHALGADDEHEDDDDVGYDDNGDDDYDGDDDLHEFFPHQSLFAPTRGASHPRGSSSLPNQSVRRDGEEGRVISSGVVERLRDRFLRQNSWRSSFPSSMDVDTRIRVLEALEEWSDLEMTGDLQVNRDFNENDYEMLLALDEDNCQIGATPARINELPLTIVESNDVEETCAICLETPTAGHTIRRLPCLHRFHTDCIDTWLRRRTLCPICKLSINASP